MSGDPYDWKPVDVAAWLKTWYKDEDSTKICNKILSDSVSGALLLQMAEDSKLEELGLEALIAGKCKKRISKIDGPFVEGRKARLAKSGGGGGGSSRSRGSLKSPGSTSEGLITDAAQVYAMFPEFEKEMIDMALTFSGGHESELIDFLLAFNTALTDTGTTAQGEQARAKLAEASPDALSNAVAVRGASSETYMSTTKAGFDDEDLCDELAPDDYEDGGYMVLEPIETEGGLLTDALECLDGSVAVTVEDGGFLPPPALIAPRGRAQTVYMNPTDKLEGLMKQFPGLSFEVVSEEFEKAGKSLEKAAWELCTMVQSNSAAEGRAGGGEDGGGGDRHATMFKQSERGMQRAASRRAATAASQPELGGNGSGGSGASAPLSSDDVERDRKCREAVAELLHTEETYSADVKALSTLLLEPMKDFALAKSGASKQLCESFNGTLVSNMWRSVWYLHRRAQQFQGALSKLVNAADGGGPEGIAAAVIEMVPKMQNSFYQYCGTCFHLQQALRGEPMPALSEIIETANANPLARKLPITSFLLVPIQRLARYPMLIDAINKRVPDSSAEIKAALADAQKKVEEMATMSNNRLATLEDQRTMTAIQTSLDFKRIADVQKVDIPGRSLIKKGLVTALKVNAKGKVLKTKEIEMILFSDMLIYGKPLPQPKQGKTCIVYKQMDRTLATASALPTSPTADIFQLEFLEVNGTKNEIRIQARSTMDKERWLDAFNPKKGKDGGRRKSVNEDVYEDFDAPLVQVVKDAVSTGSDMLEIRVGDVIQVSAKDETCGLYKGTLANTLRETQRKQVGWFPKDHTFELPSAHLRAKEARKLYVQRKEQGGKGIVSNSYK